MPRLTADDYEALANFRYLLRKFLRFSKDFLKANGNLSPEQYEALLTIRALHFNWRLDHLSAERATSGKTSLDR